MSVLALSALVMVVSMLALYVMVIIVFVLALSALVMVVSLLALSTLVMAVSVLNPVCSGDRLVCVGPGEENPSQLRKQCHLQGYELLNCTASSKEEDWGDTVMINEDTMDIAWGALHGKNL